MRVQRIFRDQENPFELSDRRFYSLYHLTEPKCMELVSLIEEEDFNHPTERNMALPPTVQILASLGFFA